MSESKNTNDMSMDELMALPVHTDYILDGEAQEDHYHAPRPEGVDGEDPYGYAHHWEQGPGILRRYSAPAIRTSIEGNRYVCTHHLRYFVEKVSGNPIKDGVRVATPSHNEVYERLRDIVWSDKGWLRAGVRIYRVSDPAYADVFVHITPINQSLCNANGGGAPGCYWTRDGKRYIHVAMDYFYADQFVRTTNHEFGHAAFLCHDMYQGTGHDTYSGVMGKLNYLGQPNYWPDEGDIETAMHFKQGMAYIVHPRHE